MLEVLVSRWELQWTYIIFYQILTAESDGNVVKYFVPRWFKASWHNARSICQSYGMEFLTMESEAEQNYLLDTLKYNSAVFSGNWVNIGGMTTKCGSRDLWYWVDTGNKVNFPIRWHANDPNCSNDSEPCMALGKFEDGNVYVVDIWCSGAPQKFLCKQKSVVFDGWVAVIYLSGNEKLKAIFSTFW